ncbi:proline-specific peptidase [Belliella baltica DSM 15883]|uniref:Proline-specific peptidase n=1 Tax=Belliella baltica (strain DSM 15883 / CIP 108006 / LMG 21964 / BA134) TaxID=866536 RepID=I3Z1B4_BELBD|nr:proline iminopeptidase-family hydrolase [Belliella baltica]AFL83032.1 proline-specific peptidase [Belliella baltica DSM 15883]
MKKSSILLLVVAIFFLQCTSSPQNETIQTNSYLDFSEREDQYEGGIKMIPITTPKGEFKVWTKRVGNNPKMKVLLLHGGPGMTHELYSCFDGYFPAEGIEYIYYDQLGSYYSDQPEDQELWTIDRFVDEVEQVRVALGLDKDNFYLFGQSWGGMLAMEYALKHQDKLKGLIISNMMSSLDDYEKYAKEVLGPQMPEEVFQEIMKIEEEGDFGNPRYEELLMEHHYQYHVLRKPLAEWPEAILRTLKHVNPNVYVFMQGYSEFGITSGATLKGWDRKDDLKKIEVPTLVIGAGHDTMDPKHMEWMSTEVKNGQYLFCPDGSHLSQYDDQKVFFDGLIKFIKEVDQNLTN